MIIAFEKNGNYWRGGRRLRNTAARGKTAAGESVYAAGVRTSDYGG